MPRRTTVRLIPEPELHDLLAKTLERVNKASNAARSRALEAKVVGGQELRDIVKEELERFKLPATLAGAVSGRVQASLARQKFGTYQSLTFPAGALKWPGSDRVTIPTSSGKRTVRVYVDPTKGSLRPPLEGKPAARVFRNGEFDLVDASAPA
jgi:hypothetical protein